MAKESEVSTISIITDETDNLEKGYYYGLYVLLQFNKEGGVYRKEDHIQMEADPDQEDMEDVESYD